MDTHWIPDGEWQTIVANVPIVSVDLVIRRGGGVLLGRRTNEPAKGDWFVPGGRVLKWETRREAVHRVAEEELGIEVEIVESLGAFEHRYESSDTEGVDSKHYLANGYVVDVSSGELDSDDQHDEFRVFESPPEPCHEYVRAYVDAASTLEVWR
jgi:colanic acid biosynthesis protein WcaH